MESEDRDFSGRVERMRDHAYEVDARIMDLLRAVAALEDEGYAVTEYGPVDPTEYEAGDEAYGILRAASLTRGAIEHAHDIMALLAAI